MFNSSNEKPIEQRPELITLLVNDEKQTEIVPKEQDMSIDNSSISYISQEEVRELIEGANAHLKPSIVVSAYIDGVKVKGGDNKVVEMNGVQYALEEAIELEKGSSLGDVVVKCKKDGKTFIGKTTIDRVTWKGVRQIQITLEEQIELANITVAGIELVKIPDNAIHKGLYFGKYEVTQAQWQAIVGTNPSKFTNNPNLPVETVSWNDCRNFITELNARSDVISAGFTFRLPTEQEWEYACLAGSKGKYGLIEDGREGKIEEIGWYGDNSKGKTHPVGQKNPNKWGLYDMHGNVSELTASVDGMYQLGYAVTVTYLDVGKVTASVDDKYRISRGGCFYDSSSNCWADSRESWGPNRSDYNLGLRLVAFRTNENLNQNIEKQIIKSSDSKQKELPKIINIAGIEMIRIPDSFEYKGLYFGKYEVTQKQWQEIMGYNPSFFKGDLNRPVDCVSWHQCQQFIEELNARSDVRAMGITFKLPTEQEWKYACLAGSTGKYGLLIDGYEGTIDEMGWYKVNSDYETHPVGQKKPNAFGLYDMHGNVCEWTASAVGESRIYCGGSYSSLGSYCSADYKVLSNGASVGLGLRLVATKTTANVNKNVGKETSIDSSKQKELPKNLTVAGIELVKIPDYATHKGLYFGKYEVTQKQWQEIMGYNPSFFKGDLNRPVEQVSWNECQNFITKLNARSDVRSVGIKFRLPTEQEWEYACRAGSKGKYGLLADGCEGSLDEMGWYCNNSGDKIYKGSYKRPNLKNLSKAVESQKTHPVGKKNVKYLGII